MIEAYELITTVRLVALLVKFWKSNMCIPRGYVFLHIG